MSSYFIVFPQGNRKKLAVVEIVDSLRYEISDYAVASRKEFPDDLPGAIKYAKQLAKDNGLEYDGDDRGDEGYLD